MSNQNYLIVDHVTNYDAYDGVIGSAHQITDAKDQFVWVGEGAVTSRCMGPDGRLHTVGTKNTDSIRYTETARQVVSQTLSATHFGEGHSYNEISTLFSSLGASDNVTPALTYPVTDATSPLDTICTANGMRYLRSQGTERK